MDGDLYRKKESMQKLKGELLAAIKKNDAATAQVKLTELTNLGATVRLVPRQSS